MVDDPRFAPPDPRAPARVLLVAVATVGALLAHPVLADEPIVLEHTRGVPWAWWVVAGWTAIASVLVLRSQLRVVTLLGALVRGAILGGVLGVLDAGASLGTIVLLRSGDPVQAAGSALMATFFGAFVGGARGVAFGLAYAPLAWLAVRLSRAPTHESRDVAVAAAGLALVAAALIRGALVSEAIDLQVAMGAAGAATAAVGLSRIAARRAFVARVRRGREPEWAIDAVPLAEPPRGVFPATTGAGRSVLYRAADVGAGPYRATSRWTPIALVSSSAP